MSYNYRGVPYEKNVRFIKEIKKYPCLYNHDTPQYNVKSVVRKTWQTIAEKFKTTVPDVKEKWRKLRVSFGRSLKQQALGKSNALFYLDEHLNFLGPYMKFQIIEKTNFDFKKLNNTSDKDESQSPVNYNDLEDDASSKSAECVEECFDQEDTKPLLEPLYSEACDTETSITRHSTMTQENPRRDYHKSQRNEYEFKDSPRKMFLLSLLPDIEAMNDAEMSAFRKDVILSIDKILTARNCNSENCTY